MSLRRAGSVILVILAVWVETAVTQQEQKPSSPVTAQASASAPVQTAPAPKEENPGASPNAIKVHGAWTIDVRNPDGSLVSHREFENSLTTGQSDGDLSLALLLARQYSMGNWMVLMYPPANQPGACPNPATTSGDCDLSENPISGASYVSPTLKVTVPTSGANQGKLVLTGSAVASGTGQIGIVNTGFRLCAPTGAASSPCGGPYDPSGPGQKGINFTSATLASAISVVAGQTVNVTVVFSFS